VKDDSGFGIDGCLKTVSGVLNLEVSLKLED
jgi:hypothetical protein